MEHDPNQPLALIKKVTQSPGPSSSTVYSNIAPKPQIPNLGLRIPSSGISSSPFNQPFFLAENVSGPAVIVTTRTPIFNKSPSISPRGQPGLGNPALAHTQVTPTLGAGRISAAVRPSSIRSPVPRSSVSPRGPPPQVRSPVLPIRPPPYGSQRLTSPPILQSMRLPPPPHSPQMKVTGPPPVAHMIHQSNLQYIRPSGKSPIPFTPNTSHTKPMSGSVIRSPTSTQQVRPVVVRGPLYRATRPSNTLLSIPGNQQQSLEAVFKSSTHSGVQQIAIAPNKQNQVLRLQQPRLPIKQQQQQQQQHQVVAGSPPSTIQLQSVPQSRQVILTPQGVPVSILPAGFPTNLKGQLIPTTNVSGKPKVFVAVNPQTLKHSPGVRIQAKPKPVNPFVVPQEQVRQGLISPGTSHQLLMPQPKVLVPVPRLKHPPRIKTGGRRGRKPGSKNKKGAKGRIKSGIYRAIAAKNPVPMTMIQNVTAPKHSIPAAPPSPSLCQAPTDQEEGKQESAPPKPDTKELDVAKDIETSPSKEIPRAVVKPQILTHVIDGFIIEESKDPFPMPESESHLPVAAGATTASLPLITAVKRKAAEPLSEDNKLRCEFCGKEDFPRKFKRSKRFCSMACAKRYNVGCTKRLGLFSPKEAAEQQRLKHKLKSQGSKTKPLKGTRGRYRRLKFNVAQQWHPKTKLILQALPSENTGGTPSASSSGTDESHSSTSSAAPTLSPIINEPDSTPFADELNDLPPGLPQNPTQWSVDEVKEFVKSVPGCGDFAEEFYSQEIDGQALMLLKEDHLMTAMNMKLGPALKIISKINSLRELHI